MRELPPTAFPLIAVRFAPNPMLNTLESLRNAPYCPTIAFLTLVLGFVFELVDRFVHSISGVGVKLVFFLFVA